MSRIEEHPNPDLGFYRYGLPELLNNVIASKAKQSKARLLRFARNDGILEFLKIVSKSGLGEHNLFLPIFDKTG